MVKRLPSSSDESEHRTPVREPDPSEVQMIEFLAGIGKGVNHLPVIVLNPSWEQGDDEDRWYFILPVGKELQVVKSSLQGFVRKQSLRDAAVAYLGSPEAILRDLVELPSITDMAHAMLITLLVPDYVSMFAGTSSD